MSFLSYFQTEMIRTFDLFPKLDALVGGRPAEGFEPSATLTAVQAAYYEGSAAEALVSDRYKTGISGVVITATGVAIPDGAKLVLDDGTVQFVIHADNPLNLGDVFVVSLSAKAL
jgi:hypothetical protein